MKERSRLTGERPQEATTPADLLALHDAGYDAICARIAPGRILDIGCGEGFETVRLVAAAREVVGVDYDRSSARRARELLDGASSAACMDASALGFVSESFDSVCSSHLIEHFVEPRTHVAEAARVLRSGGTFFVVTPNAPADFENPFHRHLFEPDELNALLGEYFAYVELFGIDAEPDVKERFEVRRRKASALLRLDLFDLRHRIPHRLYAWLYMRLLPIAYRLLDNAESDSRSYQGRWFVTKVIDPSTLVLFAVASRPKKRAT